jgi:hypothetical protein
VGILGTDSVSNDLRWDKGGVLGIDLGVRGGYDGLSATDSDALGSGDCLPIASRRATGRPHGLTYSIPMSCLAVVSGRFLFGYDIGASNGVTHMCKGELTLLAGSILNDQP